MGHWDKIQALQAILKEENLDGYMVTHQSDLNYLTDFPQEGFALLVGKERAWAFLPMLLRDHFLKEVPGCEAVAGADLVEGVKNVVRENNLSQMGFDPFYETYALGKKWTEIGFVGKGGLLGKIRVIKREEELQRLRKACAITAKAFRTLKPRVRPGRTERSVSLELEDLMQKMGAEGVAFELIVASGPNSALPHHRSSEKVIKKNEAVVIDFGCTYKLYRSDMTRTVFTGKKPDPLFQKIYGIVERSQKEGIRRVSAGKTGGEIDQVCRDIIVQEGYGDKFIHSTGHGVGVDIHEAPRVGPKSEEKLSPGMVITVEPGIYLLGKFGVRIEDTLLVTDKGSQLLTK
ncbi:MAG: aminopeptidase P family protein [Elusimicrobia bacterium]|nr:aminopeptidase P family protein [Elusimicrobiota bacterium]